MIPSTLKLNNNLYHLKVTFESLALAYATIESILEVDEGASKFLRKDAFPALRRIEKKYLRYRNLDPSELSDEQIANLGKLQLRVDDLYKTVEKFTEKYAKANCKSVSVLDAMYTFGASIDEYEEYEWGMIQAKDSSLSL